MTAQVGIACIIALRGWKPDPEWERSRDSRGGSDGSRRINSVAVLRDQFVGVLEDIPDGEEQQNVIAIFYALLRCHWILLNTQSGYQITAGKIDRDIYLQSGLLSSLLGVLEAFLDPSDISRMTHFLTQPLQKTNEETDAAPGREPTSAFVSDLPDLSLDLASLKQEANAAQKEREILENELGFSGSEAVVEHVRDLENRLKALEDLQEMLGNLEHTVSLVNL